jgi:hypothetical protein
LEKTTWGSGKNFEIGRVLHFKFEIGKLKSDLVDMGIVVVRFELSNLELEMQDSSDFEFIHLGLLSKLTRALYSC